MKIVILAGGTGSRLWPWSREKNPKQVLPILNQKTLLQQTYKRLLLGFDKKDILIATSKKYSLQIKKQLPDIPKQNFIIEPAKRDTSGAIGLAAAYVYNKNPKEILISVHADQWIGDDRKYLSALKNAANFISKNSNKSFLFGISPTYPETGYGYIQAGKKFVQLNSRIIYNVKSFLEKPNLKKAQNFLNGKNYFWNPGWFVWRVDHLFDLYKKYAPAHYRILYTIASATTKTNLKKQAKENFKKLSSHPIDTLILEKDKNSILMPLKIAWSDIGHWRSVKEMSKKDKQGNFVYGESVLHSSENNFLYSGNKKFIAALGVSDLVLVETDDAILLTNVENAQNIKSLINIIKNKKDLKKYL